MNRLIIVFDILLVLLFLFIIVIPDWNKTPVTKDYFALLIIGEIGIDLWIRLKSKVKNKIQLFKINYD